MPSFGKSYERKRWIEKKDLLEIIIEILNIYTLYIIKLYTLYIVIVRVSLKEICSDEKETRRRVHGVYTRVVVYVLEVCLVRPVLMVYIKYLVKVFEIKHD